MNNDRQCDCMLHHPYLIPQHVHLCTTEDGAVFLDINRDKYFAVDKAHLSALSRTVPGLSTNALAIAGPAAIEAVAVAEALESAGLLTRSAAGKCYAPPVLPAIDIARSVSMLDRPSSARLHHIGNFLYAWLLTSMLLRFCSLRYIVKTIVDIRSPRKSLSPQPSNVVPEDLFAIFHGLRSLVCSTKNRCLQISLALLIYLRRYRLDPVFVIGVSTNPFGAHCWLQLDTLAFDGRPDRLDPLTVIFAR